jgi:hypothetical protein
MWWPCGRWVLLWVRCSLEIRAGGWCKLQHGRFPPASHLVLVLMAAWGLVRLGSGGRRVGWGACACVLVWISGRWRGGVGSWAAVQLTAHLGWPPSKEQWTRGDGRPCSASAAQQRCRTPTVVDQRPGCGLSSGPLLPLPRAQVVDDSTSNKMLLVMDYYEGGPVMTREGLERGHRIPEEVARLYFRDMCRVRGRQRQQRSSVCMLLRTCVAAGDGGAGLGWPRMLGLARTTPPACALAPLGVSPAQL